MLTVLFVCSVHFVCTCLLPVEMKYFISSHMDYRWNGAAPSTQIEEFEALWDDWKASEYGVLDGVYARVCVGGCVFVCLCVSMCVCVCGRVCSALYTHTPPRTPAWATSSHASRCASTS